VLESDCAGCSRFPAHQFRELLTAAVYVLMLKLRLVAALIEFANAQVWTLLEWLLEQCVWVMFSTCCALVHFCNRSSSKNLFTILSRDVMREPEAANR
jgi:hypothetical protein